MADAFPIPRRACGRCRGSGAIRRQPIAAIAFGRRAVVVDGNVERVVARLFTVEEALPGAKNELHRLADRITPGERAGDFAQAMMDLGATICTPRSPACGICPLMAMCAGRLTGDPASFPRKAPKAARPRRRGTAFWLEHGGHVLLRRRPARGLLGGMLALPTGPWTEADPGLADAPADVAWHAGAT